MVIHVKTYGYFKLRFFSEVLLCSVYLKGKGYGQKFCSLLLGKDVELFKGGQHLGNMKAYNRTVTSLLIQSTVKLFSIVSMQTVFKFCA